MKTRRTIERVIGRCGLVPIKVDTYHWDRKSGFEVIACFNDGRDYRFELRFSPIINVHLDSRSIGDHYVSLSLMFEENLQEEELLEYVEIAISQIQEALSTSWKRKIVPRW